MWETFLRKGARQKRVGVGRYLAVHARSYASFKGSMLGCSRRCVCACMPVEERDHSQVGDAKFLAMGWVLPRSGSLREPTSSTLHSLLSHHHTQAQLHR